MHAVSAQHTTWYRNSAGHYLNVHSPSNLTSHKNELPECKVYRPAMLRQWHVLSPLVLGGRRVQTSDDIW